MQVTCTVALHFNTLDALQFLQLVLWYSNGTILLNMHLCCAGYYPSILRVEHPAARYQGVQGGSVEIDAKPSELRFYDKHKGNCHHHLQSWLHDQQR